MNTSTIILAFQLMCPLDRSTMGELESRHFRLYTVRHILHGLFRACLTVVKKVLWNSQRDGNTYQSGQISRFRCLDRRAITEYAALG